MARPNRSIARARPGRPPTPRRATARGGPSERLLAAYRALLTLMEATTEGVPARELPRRVVAAAATLAPGATVHLWTAAGEGRELHLTAESGPRGVASPPRRVLGTDEGLAGTVARHRRPVVLSAVRSDPRLVNRAWVRAHGFASFAGVPLARGERLLGVLCLFTRRPHRFSRPEVALLRSFAAHAAVAMESATLLETAQSRLRRLEALREIEREMARQRDPEALLGLIVRRATELLAADSATVYLLDEAAGLMRPRASFNVDPALRDLAIPVGEGAVGATLARGQGLVVNDYPHSPYAIPPFRDRDRALVTQPLLQGGRVQGVILVRRARPGHPFSPTDLVQLGDFAVQAALALENARLLHLAEARAERVKAAAQVGQLLASTRHVERILDLIAEKCREILGADGFGLFRLDPDGCLRYARGFGLDETFLETHVLAVGEGVVGRAAAERRPVETADILRDPAVYLSPAARARVETQGSRALVAVPIVHRDELLGALAVYHPPGFQIPAEEVEFLQTLAHHTAAALETARLLDQARRRRKRAETLVAVTQTLTGSLDLSAVLRLVAEGIRRLLGADGGAVGLAEADGMLRVAAGVGSGGDLCRGRGIRRGQGIGSWVLEHGEPVWAPDCAGDPRVGPDLADAARAAGVAAVLAVPVRLRGEVAGVLWAFYARAPRLTEEDLTLASQYAQVAAVALENARLYQEARLSEAQARALFEVGRLISGTLDTERVLDLIVEKALVLVGVPACGLFRLDAEGGLRYARGAGLSPEFVRQLRVQVGEGTSGRCVAEGRPVWTADILADAAVSLSDGVRALVAREGYRAALSVPIRVEAPFGCLAAYWWEPHVPTRAEIETLSSLATLAAVALENARLYGEAREHVARLERLNAASRAMSSSLRLGPVLAHIAEAAAGLLRARVVALWVAEEERRVLLRRAGWGEAGLLALTPDTLAYGEGVAGWVAARREPQLDLPVGAEPRLRGADRLLACGVRTFSAVPLLLGDRLLGVLAFGRGEAPLSPADRALLETLAGQAGIALENARLYEEAQRHEAEAVALAEASRRFGATLQREEVLERLVEAAGELLGGRWGAIPVGLARERGGRPVGAAAGATGPEWWLAAEQVAGEAVRGQRAVLVRGGAGAPLPGGEPAPGPAGPTLVVPVVTGGAVRAVLAGAPAEGARPFAERDLRLAEALAERAATALDNARLFEELTRAYQDLKTAQDRLVQTEKLRALGEMASGVAHDFNNLLAAILGRVQLILAHVEDPKLRRWLGVIERAALDGAQTVRQIQEFTRVRRDQPTEPVDVHQVVRDAVEMTRSRWRDEAQSRGVDIRVAADLAPVPPVDGQAAELRAALTNLILNAVDALPRGGTITVAARPVGDAVEIRVTDTGVGMSEEVRRRVFEPFFSTKGPQGTGLGLAMVYGIVSRHGGEVTVESREGTGSTFLIRLPASRHAGPSPPPPLPAAPRAGQARVLVIDDEPEVREALADLLRLRHHHVVTARDGAEGLESFDREPFDLVLTDLAMPGMSGWQVAATIKRRRSRTPVILVTGWGVELAPEQLRAHGVDAVMTKPFRLEEVHAAVTDALERAAAGAAGESEGPRAGEVGGAEAAGGPADAGAEAARGGPPVPGPGAAGDDGSAAAGPGAAPARDGGDHE